MYVNGIEYFTLILWFSHVSDPYELLKIHINYNIFPILE